MKIFMANLEEIACRKNDFSIEDLSGKVNYLEVGLWGAEIESEYGFAIDNNIVIQLIKECEIQNLYYCMYTSNNILSSIPNQIFNKLFSYAKENGKNDFERLCRLVHYYEVLYKDTNPIESMLTYIQRNDIKVYLIKKIIEDGHAVINHTMKHLDITSLSKEQIEQEILGVDDKLEKFFGIRTNTVRLPYGKGDLKSCEYILNMGYEIAFWSYNTCDWVIKDKDDLLRGFSGNIRNGEIILLHSYENKEHTVKALPFIISGLQQRGYTFGIL